MPGRRCVVQGCNNTPNLEGGILVYISPKNKSARDKWARFVRTHRANFNPRGRFMICSEQFAEEYFERSLHVERSQRTLRPGSVPSIWMNKNSEEPPTSRSVRTRKEVSACFLLFWYILHLPSLSNQLYFWFSNSTLSVIFQVEGTLNLKL